jgi:hypothetical protein
MRAKYPMVQVTKDGKKEWARSETLEPKQADDILFEMFVHGWIDQAHNLHVTKYTLPELASIIEDGKPISIESGRALANWAKGGQSVPLRQSASAATGAPSTIPPTQDGAPELSDAMQLADDSLALAATKGKAALQTAWLNLDRSEQKTLKSRLDETHKPNAEKVA